MEVQANSNHTKSNKIMLGFPQQVSVNSQVFSESKNGSSPWINFGKKNNYPDFLWQLYLNCSIHQSIIDGTLDYVCGEGINSSIDRTKKEELFRLIAFDFIVFGGFALEVIYNMIGDIAQVNHIDFMKCRTNKELDKVYFKNKWDETSSYSSSNLVKKEVSVEYDVFDPKAEHKTAQILYYRGSKTRSVYPIPRYIGSTQAIETAIEIQNYHINAIRNNFSISAVINFNNGQPGDDEKRSIEQAMIDKFTGSTNASNFMLSFNDNKDSAVTVERLDSDDADTKFEQLSKDTKENIFIGHRVTSGALFGLVSESTGFNSIEYENAFKLYNKTVIQPIQKEITRELSYIFGDTMEVIPYEIPKFDDVEHKTKTAQ